MDPFLQLLLVAGPVVLLVLAAAANPLQSLLLQTERLRSAGGDASPELKRETVGAILAEAERVSEFLTELRLYASGAARRPELYAMDLGGRADSVVRRRSLHERTGVRVVFSGDQPLPVRGDAYLLDQCAENLVKNAQEATAENGLGGEVRVSALRKGGMATILVEDDGPGLRDDQLLSIFEPFHTTRSRGMGLGLPICRDVAHAHGGTLQAGKETGGGARFVLALPLREGAGEG